ncbi:MAG: UMP kinase [Dehalococcoidia bacterium]|nr:UMP kinase [Dehalococcoidia bacterium]MDD5493638.1 UMP kinase [Dehalococcoidia bacterium]
MSKPKLKFKRVLLKLSGEALMGNKSFGIDPKILDLIAGQIKKINDQDIEVAIVVGGGNFWRGASAEAAGMDRATADYAGMLATIINALALQDALENHNIVARTLSAITIWAIAEPHIRRRAIRHLEKKRVVIFAGGTGNPYMTTDTAAALRAIEISADVLLVAKNKVDGVYDSDPRKNPRAKKYRRLTHQDAMNLELEVMDITAFSLCKQNKLPIIVFDLQEKNSILRVIEGEDIGTVVTNEETE